MAVLIFKKLCEQRCQSEYKEAATRRWMCTEQMDEK
jgi:hypothetical protein